MKPHRVERLPARRVARGFTLVELAALCAVSVLLCALALPSYRAALQRASRADAVDALTRLQLAQAQYRAHHGLFASDLAVLHGVPQPRSSQGHYQMDLQSRGAEGYRATAAAVPGGRQAGDAECATLSLDVNHGFAQVGPSARCWNR
jgi:type IV pilus assembly protein PilE